MTLSTIKDPSLKINVHPDMKELILVAYDNTKGADDIPTNVVKLVSGEECKLVVNDVKWIYSKLSTDMKRRMYKIIESCDIVLPEPEVIPRNQQLEARIQKLKLLSEERHYQSMTKNVDTCRTKHPEDTIAYQISQINRQMIAVVQVLVSISAGFLFGFSGIEYIVGTMDMGTRIFIGLFCSFIIAVAEFYFLIKNLEYVPPSNPLISHTDHLENHPHKD